MLFEYPTSTKTISQPFGLNNSDNPKRKNFYLLFNNKHPGVDFDLIINTPIYASYPGIVVRREFHKGMGKTIGTRYGNIVVLYAHLNNILPKLGQKIKVGELIGHSGKTGSACPTPHLHLEVRDISKPSLKEMVFDPPFGKEIQQQKEIFNYIVNNSNTQKTLKFLALRYFGNQKYWEKIQKANPKLNLNANKPIPDQTIIKVPNY